MPIGISPKLLLDVIRKHQADLVSSMQKEDFRNAVDQASMLVGIIRYAPARKRDMPERVGEQEIRDCIEYLVKMRQKWLDQDTNGVQIAYKEAREKLPAVIAALEEIVEDMPYKR